MILLDESRIAMKGKEDAGKPLPTATPAKLVLAKAGSGGPSPEGGTASAGVTS